MCPCSITPVSQWAISPKSLTHAFLFMHCENRVAITYWHANSYPGKKTIRMQLHQFLYTNNYPWNDGTCLFATTVDEQKYHLMLPSWEQVLKSISICVPASRMLLPPWTDLVLFFSLTKRLKFGNGSQYTEYWGGFCSCFLDCIKLDIGHGAVFSSGLKHICARPLVILLEWRNAIRSSTKLLYIEYIWI